MELLLRGLSYAQIGSELGLSERTINDYASRVYAQHGVHGRRELARKLDRPDPAPTKQSQVRMHLDAGLSLADISARMGISLKAVRHHMYALRKRGPAIDQSVRAGQEAG
jgi:DNA-binding NarL/FixJ family response regulator